MLFLLLFLLLVWILDFSECHLGLHVIKLLHGLFLLPFAFFDPLKLLFDFSGEAELATELPVHASIEEHVNCQVDEKKEVLVCEA